MAPQKQPSTSVQQNSINTATTQLLNFPILENEISVDSVARYFGGRSGYKPDKKTSDRIERCIGTACKLAAPKGTYTILPVTKVSPGKEMYLYNGLQLIVPDCFDDLGTRLVAISIGTLGEELERQCRSLAKSGEIYESTLFDSVGTTMLDLLSEKISDTIANSCKNDGLLKGERFSPGLDGYPLEHQRLLFDLADNDSVGVSLNSSNIMIPTKSVSFFLVLTKTPQKQTKNKCNSCRMRNCQFRLMA